MQRSKNDVVKKDANSVKSKDIDIENKIPDVTNLCTNASLNAKINEVKNKIPNTTNSATTTALIAVENKTPDHSKYITTAEFNKSTAENLSVRLTKMILLISSKRQILMIN